MVQAASSVGSSLASGLQSRRRRSAPWRLRAGWRSGPGGPEARRDSSTRSAGSGWRAVASRNMWRSRSLGRGRRFAERPLGQHARRLDVLRLVQQQERLERRVGAFAADLARLARGGVERGHLGRRRGPLPERVEAAAVDLLDARVGLEPGRVAAGVGDRLPQAGRLRRLDARSSHAARRAGRETNSAWSRRVSASSRNRGPRESSRLAGSFARRLGRRLRGLAVRGRHHHPLDELLDVPAVVAELRRPASRAARGGWAARPASRSPRPS